MKGSARAGRPAGIDWSPQISDDRPLPDPGPAHSVTPGMLPRVRAQAYRAICNALAGRCAVPDRIADALVRRVHCTPSDEKQQASPGLNLNLDGLKLETVLAIQALEVWKEDFWGRDGITSVTADFRLSEDMDVVRGFEAFPKLRRVAMQTNHPLDTELNGLMSRLDTKGDLADAPTGDRESILRQADILRDGFYEVAGRRSGFGALPTELVALSRHLGEDDLAGLIEPLLLFAAINGFEEMMLDVVNAVLDAPADVANAERKTTMLLASASDAGPFLGVAASSGLDLKDHRNRLHWRASHYDSVVNFLLPILNSDLPEPSKRLICLSLVAVNRKQYVHSSTAAELAASQGFDWIAVAIIDTIARSDLAPETKNAWAMVDLCVDVPVVLSRVVRSAPSQSKDFAKAAADRVEAFFAAISATEKAEATAMTTHPRMPRGDGSRSAILKAANARLEFETLAAQGDEATLKAFAPDFVNLLVSAKLDAMLGDVIGTARQGGPVAFRALRQAVINDATLAQEPARLRPLLNRFKPPPPVEDKTGDLAVP